jgi:tetratricopeptide (TPR) repeat protein
MASSEDVSAQVTPGRQDLADRLARAWQGLDADPAATRGEAEAMRQSAPGDGEITLLLAASLRRQGDVFAAFKMLGPLMAPQVASPIAWFEWGMMLGASNDEALAIGALQRAVKHAPGFVAAWRALGDQHIVLGEAEPAGSAYACAARAMLADTPLAAPAAMLATGRAAKAEQTLKAIVQANPEDARAVWLLAEAAMRVGRAGEAETLLKHCLVARPGFAEARHSLAILLYLGRRFGEAAPLFKTLLELRPHQPSLQVLLATSLVAIDHAAAVPVYEAMLDSFPGRSMIRLRYGQALKALGREAEAARAYRTCLQDRPDFTAGLYLSLADMKTVAFTDAEIADMRGLLTHSGLNDFQRAQTHYALARALEQAHDDQAAFGHFAQGAALRRLGITYRADATTAYVDANRAVFTEPFFASRTGSGSDSTAPIFIVGLPRAGSTLIEQILASHPAVEGTQELELLPDMAANLQGNRPWQELPGIITGLDGPQRAHLGRAYLQAAQQFRILGRPFFTDKMPQNFLYTGLIQLILPNARIIDIRRAPMAAGFAAFQQFFQAQQTGQDYSYDLGEIGRYYQDYIALMDHFDEALPNRVLHLNYESLVTDTEAQIRRLLDHCGLSFDPACLRFWETSRSVHTPSAQQVRQPIFRQGLDHWRRYETWLEPLRKALGPLA